MLNDKKWQKLELSHSFRITNEMSNFINHCMLKEERISSYKKSGIKPRYLVCNTFQKIENAIFDEIRYYLRMGYQYDEIFILAPSIKTKGTNDSPVRILENKIKQEMSHIPIYIPTSDDEKVDDEIMKNKLLFLTFHQTKGLERKVVIVFNFDESYLLHFPKRERPDKSYEENINPHKIINYYKFTGDNEINANEELNQFICR
jgi:superfamily I DNA/RNA helicase